MGDHGGISPVIEMQFRIGGFKELERAFNQLPNAMSKGVLRGAIRAALKPIKQDAKNKVPVRTGGLRDSIVIGTKLTRSQQTGGRTGAVRLFLGTEWPEGAHGHLIEFGTSKIKANPFLRPAWDANKRDVPKIVGDIAWKKLQLLARRLFRQAKAGKLSRVGRKALV